MGPVVDDGSGAGKMSVVYLKPAWQAEGLSPSEKLVLLKLADQASDDGLCWPSIETIRTHTALGKTAVYRSLARRKSAD